MNTVRAESETRLKEMLQTVKPYQASWRAMAFNFSLLKEHTNIDDIKKVAFGIITNEISEYEGTIHFMSDEDIIVIGKAISKKDFDAIKSEISFHVPEEFQLKMMLPLCMLYDLGVSWEELFEISHEKFVAAEARRETTGTARVTKTEDHEITTTNKLTPHNQVVQSRNTVLVVEDDPLSIFITKKALDADCIVYTVENGEDALTAYIKYKPDVVFLDIGLPDISGHDVLQRIILEINPSAYIVMLSANNTPTDIMHALQLGAQGFISKPFSKSKLIQYISQSPTFKPFH